MFRLRGKRPVKPRKVRTAFLIALLPGLLGIVLSRYPPAENLERGALDQLFALRGERPPQQRVCVIALDLKSYSVLGLDEASPWPRSLHARLIRTLKREGASVVAFDILFDEPRDPSQDAELEAAIRESGNVVLGATVERTADPRAIEVHLVEPWQPFKDGAAATGEVTFATDRDGRIRSTWLMHDDTPSLALAAYETATGDRSKRSTEGRLIDYYGRARTIPTLSYYQALDPGQYLPPGYFKDRLVFVGISEGTASGPAAKDAYLTPYSERNGDLTYGVEIHATVTANLLERRRIDLLPPSGEGALLLVLPLFAAFTFMVLGPLAGGVAFVVLELVPIATGALAFSKFHLWIPVAIPTVFQLPVAYAMSLTWYYLTTRRERERIRRAFSFYLSPEMIQRVTANPDELNLGGQEIVATAVMTDLKGFTTISESQTAPETAAMLNAYFSDITAHIFATKGTLIKFIGDAVFAIWGAPLRMDDHATQACLAALAMARTVRRGEGPELITRIGVHTGPMLVGNLGSAQRFDYTAIGDAVNLASRLEGLNKPLGTTALVSGAALAATDGRFVTRPLGLARVVGRQEPVEIHELVGLRGESTRPGAEAIDAFRRGLEAFAARRWDDAEAAFRHVIEACGGKDAASAFYLSVVDRHRAAPPPEGWYGVVTFESK